MKRVIAVLFTLLIAIGVLGACSDSGTEAPTGSAGSAAEAMLAKHDLDGLSTAQIIDKLEATQDDRTAQLVGSVGYDSLQLTDGTTTEKITMPIDNGEFYLSMAPFVSKTHECYYHNLASCQGELIEQAMHVTVTSADGETLVDETVTTHANGFAGFWLPRDISGTITVEYDGKSVEAPFATNADSPTCVTTLQLT